MTNATKNVIDKIRVDYNANDFLLEKDVRKYNIAPSTLIKYDVIREACDKKNVRNITIEDLIDAYNDLVSNYCMETCCDFSDFKCYDVDDNGDIIEYDAIPGYRVNE